MRAGFGLVLLFLFSSLSPLVAAATTETQFSDGTTSYTQTFQSQGNASAGTIDIPVGAEVTEAEFNIKGDPSSSQWSNLTSNTDFGGKGTSSWSGVPPGMAYGYRTSVEVKNNAVQLQGQPTSEDVYLNSVSDVASNTGHHNTTGQFIANGNQGFIGSSSTPTSDSVSGAAARARTCMKNGIQPATGIDRIFWMLGDVIFEFVERNR